MKTTFEHIVIGMEKDIPRDQEFILQNYSDLSLLTKTRRVNQFIVGLTRQDQMGSGIEQYEYYITGRLRDFSNKIKAYLGLSKDMK